MTQYMICTPTADILANPDAPENISPKDSQMLFGEDFIVDNDHGDWVIGKSAVDGYAGHVHKGQLTPRTDPPTHIVDVRMTHIYPAPDFKTPPLMPLSFLSRVNIDQTRIENGFAPINDMGWVFAAHLSDIDMPPHKQDIVETALLYIGTPYLYGGRSSLGIDCSGLIQNALLRHGIDCPRDSGDQEKSLTKPIQQGNIERGDIVFFKGHVGIMVDKTNILNATARHMRTLIEPLEDLRDQYGAIISCKRIA